LFDLLLRFYFTKIAVRILITNIMLKERSGTEIATRDLALGLLAAGHEPLVYSPSLGEISDEIARAGIVVTNDLGDIAGVPDIIHGHHYVETVKALVRFPKTSAIFVVHDPTGWHDVPPLSPQIRRYVAVDYNCHARLTDRYQIPAGNIRVIFNAYDPRRFPPRQNPVTGISRALVFSNYAGPGGFVEYIREACAELNIPLDVIGAAMKRSHPNPGEILGQYDLIFGIGRCAVEASATGAAVIICGDPGLGPFVTTANIQQLFGRDYPYVPATKDRIISEIRKVNPKDTHDLSEYIRATRQLPFAINQYLALYAEVLADPLPPAVDAWGEMLCATARHLQKMEFLAPLFPCRDFSTRLPRRISRKLTLRIVNTPEVVVDAFVADVELENRGDETLSPNPPYPVNISYRWISHEGKMIVREGRRTLLPAPLKPGEKQQYRIRVDLPGQSGNYRLRVTLVQEQVMWLDELSPPVAAEIPIMVKLAGSSGSNAGNASGRP
jgi:hypothetical protein